ncbi:MAG: sulfite exporter TauE/SafE family protein [Flavobacteriales bacterium]
MEWLEWLGFASAVIVGLVLGLIGGGGSILTVPVLVYFMEIPPALATAYSLFVVGLSSGFGAWRHFQSGLIDVKTGTIFAGPSLLAVYATRRWLVPSIPKTFHVLGLGLTKDLFIMVLFAILMIAASLSMIKGRKTTSENGGRAKWWLVPFEGIAVGVLTGIVGAGGGFLIIPALVVLVKMPMKTAIGTSLMIIAAKSLIGFIGDLGSGQDIEWGLLSVFTALTVFGIILGLKWSKTLDGESLKKGFGWFVLIMGAVILLKELLAH